MKPSVFPKKSAMAAAFVCAVALAIPGIGHAAGADNLACMKQTIFFKENMPQEFRRARGYPFSFRNDWRFKNPLIDEVVSIVAKNRRSPEPG